MQRFLGRNLVITDLNRDTFPALAFYTPTVLGSGNTAAIQIWVNDPSHPAAFNWK